MKRVFALLLLVLVTAVFVYSQVQPNGPQQSFTWGTTTQGTKSRMVGGPHDFGPGGPQGAHNQSNGTCDYCHRPHIIGADGQAAPLWARKSLNSALTYGVYSSVSLDANDTAGSGSPHIYAINSDNNYSAFCLSCHDGSAFLATSSWGSNSHPYIGTNPWPFDSAAYSTLNVGDAFSFRDAGGLNTNGELALSHTHPVNFDYDYVAARDQQIYAKAAAGYVWRDGSGIAIGRLFGGRMQCESCHNPHFKVGIGLQSPSTDQGGALCVACHKK